MTPAATTTYTLTVTGVNGTVTKTVTVTVAGTSRLRRAPSRSRSCQTGAENGRRQAGPHRRVRVRGGAWARNSATCSGSWGTAADTDAQARR